MPDRSNRTRLPSCSAKTASAATKSAPKTNRIGAASSTARTIGAAGTRDALPTAVPLDTCAINRHSDVSSAAPSLTSAMTQATGPIANARTPRGRPTPMPSRPHAPSTPKARSAPESRHAQTADTATASMRTGIRSAGSGLPTRRPATITRATSDANQSAMFNPSSAPRNSTSVHTANPPASSSTSRACAGTRRSGGARKRDRSAWNESPEGDAPASTEVAASEVAVIVLDPHQSHDYQYSYIDYQFSIIDYRLSI